MIDYLLDLLLMKIIVFGENIYAMLHCELPREICLLIVHNLGDGYTWFNNFRYNVDQSSYFHKYENT